MISFVVGLFTASLDIIYAIKWCIAYISIRLHSAFQKRRFDFYDIRATGDPEKLGFAVPQFEKDLESPSDDHLLQQNVDEVMFYGVNSKGECLLVRITRGPNQVAEAWIYLKLEDGKTYTLAETSGYQQPYEGKCLNFSCGKLQMQYLSPMRRWRIFYCGMLRETSPEKKDIEESVFVKFVFLWKASSDVYDLTLDSNPKGFASALARSKWKIPLIPPVKEFVEAVDFYAQSGVIDGTVSVEGGEEYEMYLFGEKMRSQGKSENIAGCKFTNVLGLTLQDGFIFHLGQASTPDIFHKLPYGFVVQPLGSIEPVLDLDISIDPFCQQNKKSKFKLTFTGNEQYEISGTSLSEPVVLYRGQGWSGYVELSFIELSVGDKKGRGIILSGEVYQESKKSNKPTPAPIAKIPENVPLTVQFSDEICCFGEISGGKGSSLGKLTQLSNRTKSFTVPKGIVVTTAAYNGFLTTEIINAVKHLENIAYGNVEGDVKVACKLVSSVVEKTALPKRVCHSIIEDLKDVFVGEIETRRFAVRSSATGEDTSAMSAAGQMDTFLGVQGLKAIFEAVRKCWASQFSHIASEYKRQNGQILNSPMAVVIQEMVACEVSGVLFTCDPVTNNPSFVTITANYGLGETVVSGSVEPDTVTLRRKENEGLTIESVQIGTKHQKIVMEETGGTVIEDLPESTKEESCLSEDTAIRLGKLAIEIEKFYKSSRDIEWGILDNQVYMLQSRPVTNVAGETEYEMKREFDAPLKCENEYFTVANVGEVFPDATSPLGMDVVIKVFSTVIKKESHDKGVVDNFLQSKYFPSGILMFYNHSMITVKDLLIRYGIDSPKAKGFMVSIFGRILDDPELLSFVRERFEEPPPPTILSEIRNFRDLFFHAYDTHKIKEKLFRYEMKCLKEKTAEEAFAGILNTCSDFDDGILKHLLSTESSSSWNMHLFSILCSSKGNFDNDVYSDFARLLATSSDVESADVPQSLQALALQIEKDISSDAFKNMAVEDAVQWLQTSSSASGRLFHEFLKRHGHRCLKEFDIKSITWAMNPKTLVGLLQSMVGSIRSNTKADDSDYDKLFSELNVSLGFWSRLLLRFVLPNCRRAVSGREAGKSLTIKSFDYLRQGYRHLAKLMVSEGRIPDADLIFFFTVEEIGELLKTRSPSIISRANYRRRIFPTLSEYKFPEISRGLPKPLNDKAESAETYKYVADLTMKGTPVSQGVTKGFARVAMSLEEASHLKPGEILITYSTDIGWSPYFPIVSGVVTELGGLISHGAVVSREYGLPCVVGVQGATKRFQTGDYVLLDGKKGILQRLPKPE